MIDPTYYTDNPNFVEFLSVRGLKLNESSPKVIHYFGRKYSELEKMMRNLKADLAVLHGQLDSQPGPHTWFNFIVDRLNQLEDMTIEKEVYTNNVALTQLYYQRLGLNRTIVPITPPKPKEPKKHFDFVKSISKIMMWG